jgi:hypothetical protein
MPLLSTAWCIPHLGVSYANLNNSSIGATATIPAAEVPAITAATIVVEPYSYSTSIAGCHQAPIVVSH